MNVKTQYETVNNTFTNAVANFNDNNDGYMLGDSVVHAVSLNTHGNDWSGGKCKTATSRPKRGLWAVYVN